MSSTIEAAARKLVENAKDGMYTDEHILKLIKAVKECDEDPDGKKALYRAAAKDQYQSDGDLEIDDDTVVSLSEDGGAYVQCWKWIPQPEDD
jgi:hypothetical protein